ncbi:MAG: YitT family protein [Bacteroidota bacterium]
MIFKTIQSYAIITFGLFLFSLSLTAFLLPMDIVGGGVTGIGALIFYATGLPVGYTVLGVNAILILLAIKRLGANFGIKTIFGIVVMSLMLTIMQKFITKPIVEERFMAAIIGGILSGASIGLIFTQGGSTGGTDIIAMLITQKRNISPGKIFLYCDVIIIASSFLLFQSIETIVYGYVTMGVSSYVIDIVLVGARQSVQVFIFSKENRAIADKIGNGIGRGVTFIKGEGWYSGEETEIIMVIVRKHEVQDVFRMVKELDGNAFLSVANVMGVYGKGFDKIRT